MTIVKKGSPIETYPFRALAPDVVELFQRCAERRKVPSTTTLKLLECFCDITNQPLSFLKLSSSELTHIVAGFQGALFEQDLVGTSDVTRAKISVYLQDILLEARNYVPSMPPTECGSGLRKKYNTKWKKILLGVDQCKVNYWTGWPVENRKGTKLYCHFANIHNSHGHDFTSGLYEQLRLHISGYGTTQITMPNKMAGFLSQNSDSWPEYTFNDSTMIYNFFWDFRESFFMSGEALGLDIDAQMKTWNKYIGFVEKIFILPGVWAEPLGGKLPLAPAKRIDGQSTNVRKNDDGAEVKVKLVMEVPLHVTESEAIEILFISISKRLKIIEGWAKAQIADLYSRVLRRKQLAANGELVDTTKRKKGHLLIIPNICCIFETYGYGEPYSHYASLSVDTKDSQTPASDLASYMGMPLTGSLMPFKLLIILRHPIITSEFLGDFDLWNKQGQRSGYVLDGSVYKLVGYKDRKGAGRSEQKITLTSETKALVDQIIEITAPLREYLKSQGDPSWRKLFITCGNAFSPPVKSTITPWSRSTLKPGTYLRNNLLAQFRPHTDMPEDDLVKFLEMVSASSVRASRVTEIFIKTHSAETTSQALGHDSYDPNLMDHYLPKVIIDFLHERRMRVFNKVLICHSLKDSPFLFRASNFSSVDELDTFLVNHAFGDIPAYLQDPEGRHEKLENDGTVYALVSADILSVLLSIKLAVEQAPPNQKVNAKAVYWASYAGFLEGEISKHRDVTYRSDLHKASLTASAASMERFVYECSI
ncbi:MULTISPECIES: hypothetical protein [Pseudomonas fluorescens group]|uniref:Uncharacterized protein n=2 Tax=Pseudomonas fluorescens group TaxID=136843 RepID=A0ABY0VKM1_9PSED|nr:MULTISPECIES: hypothetical protein [Pseudomonas fluorescens group]RXE52300.1 hypothetical protein B4O85_13120 [Pseudomonas azotoformans]TWS09353.1 hypothetical protein FJD35_15575 [Pseudomonas mandelii]SDU37152.1 hypothetical protein SAMN04489801_2537 [Pseudomonas mandelii]